jgi:methionyl-tRNA formyltransferase|tara:strand:- start:25409 stop:26281 length:873 start_codon:yes stop_codon:yes gene_type:complete
MKIGVLASGNLGLDVLRKINSDYDISFVFTDNSSNDILKLCKENKIPFFVGNPRKGIGYNFIKNICVDIIVSVNYLFLIEKDIIQHSRLITFNIHGSLLPKYRGRTPHVWAIINNENEAGITAHVIDENCDSGEIITQIKIPINENDTGNDLLNKYKSEYYDIVKNVFDKAKSGQLKLNKQDDNLATYFGKRNPDDGEINWNWQRERIQNWVRAQSFPYPGAFTYYNGYKITIDEVVKSTLGFSSNEVNGTILEIRPNLVVKTQNGALEIKRYREKVKFAIGEELGNHEK